VAERFAAVLAKGKSRSSESGMGTPLATIEFIARAPGVASRAGIRTKIQGAMDGTRRILASKLKKIVAGYRYDWETGRVFRDKNDIITRSE
jgi:hypothetical protein